MFPLALLMFLTAIVLPVTSTMFKVAELFIPLNGIVIEFTAGFGNGVISTFSDCSKPRFVVNSTFTPAVTSLPKPVAYHVPEFSTKLTGCP